MSVVWFPGFGLTWCPSHSDHIKYCSSSLDLTIWCVIKEAIMGNSGSEWSWSARTSRMLVDVIKGEETMISGSAGKRETLSPRISRIFQLWPFLILFAIASTFREGSKKTISGTCFWIDNDIDIDINIDIDKIYIFGSGVKSDTVAKASLLRCSLVAKRGLWSVPPFDFWHCCKTFKIVKVLFGWKAGTVVRPTSCPISPQQNVILQAMWVASNYWIN